MKERVYIAIDLKSFYASVECRERGLDPTAIPIKNANIQSHETMQRYQIKKLDCKLWE